VLKYSQILIEEGRYAGILRDPANKPALYLKIDDSAPGLPVKMKAKAARDRVNVQDRQKWRRPENVKPNVANPHCWSYD
jgi:hypothetical protein